MRWKLIPLLCKTIITLKHNQVVETSDVDLSKYLHGKVRYVQTIPNYGSIFLNYHSNNLDKTFRLVFGLFF